MVIHGREIKFRRTVLANCEIAELSPDGDINKFEKLLQGKYALAQRSAAAFMAAMSKGYEMERQYEEPGYQMRPLTVEEALLLDNDAFNDLFAEALAVFADDGKTTVDAEAPKQKGKNADGDGA